MKRILALIMTAVFAVFADRVMAAIPEPVSLTPFIQLNEAQTAAIVYGTQGGSWNNVSATRIPAAFDGDTSTYTDLITDEAWGGVGFTKPVRVTKIRHYSRSVPNGASLVGALLQGANSSDFSDAVTVKVLEKERASAWVEEGVTTCLGQTSSFRYYRVYTKGSFKMGAFFGNIAELEFYGYDPETVVQTVPEKPTVSYTCLINGRLCFTATTGANTTYIEVQQRWKGEGDGAWKEVLAITPTAEGKAVNYAPNMRFALSSDFRFRAVNATATSDWTDVFSEEQPSYLTGAYIGSTSYYA